MSSAIRNRIKEHRRVRAGDLVRHEWNYRLHPAGQRSALQALYEEVGFARSLLVYELPDGRLKLIDGHLRREMDPEMEVEVEVLAINDDEARTLLLSLDPLARLAQTQEQLHDRLLELTPTNSPELAAAWRAEVEGLLTEKDEKPCRPVTEGPARFLVLVTCRDEAQQVELLGRLAAEGLECRALLSE